LAGEIGGERQFAATGQSALAKTKSGGRASARAERWFAVLHLRVHGYALIHGLSLICSEHLGRQFVNDEGTKHTAADGGEQW
jgi:hypothetical protein